MIRDYVATLQAQDSDHLRQYLHDLAHLAAPTLDRIQYQLIAMTDAEIQADHATAIIHLRNCEGTTLTGTLTLECEHDPWCISNPDLAPSSLTSLLLERARQRQALVSTSTNSDWHGEAAHRVTTQPRAPSTE